MAASWLIKRLYDKYLDPFVHDVGQMVVQAGETSGIGVAVNPNAPRPPFVPF
jgi:hypothetical protein